MSHFTPTRLLVLVLLIVLGGQAFAHATGGGPLIAAEERDMAAPMHHEQMPHAGMSCHETHGPDCGMDCLGLVSVSIDIVFTLPPAPESVAGTLLAPHRDRLLRPPRPLPT